MFACGLLPDMAYEPRKVNLRGLATTMFFTGCSSIAEFLAEVLYGYGVVLSPVCLSSLETTIGLLLKTSLVSGSKQGMFSWRRRFLGAARVKRF